MTSPDVGVVGVASEKKEGATITSARRRKRTQCDLCGASLGGPNEASGAACARCGYARVVTRRQQTTYRQSADDRSRTVTLRFPLAEPRSGAIGSPRLVGAIIAFLLAVSVSITFIVTGSSGWALFHLVLGTFSFVCTLAVAHRAEHAPRETVICVDCERMAVKRGGSSGDDAILLSELERISVERTPNFLARFVGPGTQVRRTVDAVVDDAGVRGDLKAFASRLMQAPAGQAYRELALKEGARERHDVVLRTSSERILVVANQVPERANAFARILRREAARAWRRGAGANDGVIPWAAHAETDARREFT